MSDRAIHSCYSLSERRLGIYMSPPSGTSLPPPTPSHPLGCHRAPGLSSLNHTANSHWLSILQPMPDSCWSMAEANTILWDNCPPIKKKKKRKEEKKGDLAILNPWFSTQSLESACWVSPKIFRNLIRIAFSLLINLRRNDIFIIFSHSIHEHGIFLNF